MSQRSITSLMFLLIAVISSLSISGCGQHDRKVVEAAPPVTSDPPLSSQEPPEAKPLESDLKKDNHKGKSPTHKANRLASETSPYLLMHAYNPVDWYPWGKEAFEKAKREKKIIFLSIGYSSCYWCHVMERESFMDEEIAAYLNENYVCIKVDREERPNVDDIYMTSIHLLTGSGGWPLSAFLTPDAKPFYGGTYFPARDGDRGSRMGFLSIIKGVDISWHDQPDAIKKQAENVAAVIPQVLREQQLGTTVELTDELITNAMVGLRDQFDPEHGGFGFSRSDSHRPKFPSPPILAFIADAAIRRNDKAARDMLVLTLDQMARGGIWDHIGGGFHRYSTDRFWHIPHFEKMLYDNGQLAAVYAAAFQLTGRADYRQVAVRLLEFTLREMTDSAGAFYAAIDAETDAEEGKFYRWDLKEVESLLGDEEWTLVRAIYGFGGKPNFEREYFVPMLQRPLAEVASELAIGQAEMETRLAAVQAKMLEFRDRRERPLTDTKILTAWNGLMIRGFADCGRIFKEQRYVEAAGKAADFVLTKLRKDGRLLRTYRSETAKLNAYLDDYAFLIDGLIALHRATGDERWLKTADELMQKQIELFWDDKDGGFYFTSDDHETLLARAKKRTDSVLPSGNSVSAGNLLYLASALSNDSYRQRARQTITAFAQGLDTKKEARSMPRMAQALANLLNEQKP